MTHAPLDPVFRVAGILAVAACMVLGALRAVVLGVQVVTWLWTGRWVPFR